MSVKNQAHKANYSIPECFLFSENKFVFHFTDQLSLSLRNKNTTKKKRSHQIINERGPEAKQKEIFSKEFLAVSLITRA